MLLLRGDVVVIDVAVRSVDVDRTTPVVRMRACLDVTDVETVDLDGNPVQPSSGEVRRIPHLYSAVYEDGRWLVANHGFPVAASC